MKFHHNQHWHHVARMFLPRLISDDRCFSRLGWGILALLCLGMLGTTRATDVGESIPLPIAHTTYIFTPGKFTGKEFTLEKTLWREFRFDPHLINRKPKETVSVRLSLRGGYRAYDLFGHDEFEPKEAKDVAVGWLPQSGGSFLIFPDESKEHLPKWIPERTRLIRVPLIKQYGDTVVNAYDLALGLDRVAKGEEEVIPFQLTPMTEGDKKGVRLTPAKPLAIGVYFAYSLPEDAKKYDGLVHGLLFAVGTPVLGSGDSQGGQGQTSFQPNICLLPDVQLARDVMDYALLSEAVYSEKTAPNWELLVTDTCPISGMVCWKNVEETSFQVQVYRFKGGNKLAVAFRGTEPTKLGDWKADVQNFFNGVPKQYEQAVDFVKQVVDKAGSDCEVVLTGHSLGGGLASYAALRLRKTAIVFNAAGLGRGLRDKIPSENLELQKKFVRNINLIGDPVSGLGGQVGIIYALNPPASLIGRVGVFVDNRSLMVGPIFALHPEASGEAHAVSINPIDYHFIEPLLETLKGLAK